MTPLQTARRYAESGHGAHPGMAACPECGLKTQDGHREGCGVAAMVRALEDAEWRPEDIELAYDALEDCRPWGASRDYLATEAIIASMTGVSDDIRRAYRARNEQVNRIQRLLPILPPAPLPTEP